MDKLQEMYEMQAGLDTRITNERGIEKTTDERCGKPLNDAKSVELGFGPACHKKHRKELADAEFERLQITIFEVLGHDI